MENSENSAIATQLYKSVGELVRILDRVNKSATTMKDLHLPKVISYRLRMRETCERLMFVDPVRHGKKAEDLLWKMVYYDVISMAKKLLLHKSPSWTPSDQHRVKSHIRLGMGTYHHLLFRLQSEYVFLGGECFTDFILPINFRGSSHGSFSGNNTANKNKKDEKEYEWALQAYQRCLICLGDLARYNQEYCDGSPFVAARFYHQALTVCNASCMPFNQLGTLFTNNNYGFDSVYYYMRCTLFDNVFEGALGNMNRIFEKNSVWLDDMLENGGKLQKQTSPVNHFLCQFISYAELAYKKQTDEVNASIGELCEIIIEDFQYCLDSATVEMSLLDTCSNARTSCPITHDMIFKMFVMAFISVDRFEKLSSPNALAATAFILALLSKLLNYILNCLETCVNNDIDNRYASASLFPDEKPVSKVEKEVINSCEVDSNISVSEKKPRKNKIIRHRRKKGNDDSDLSEGGEDSENDEKSEDDTEDESDSSIDFEDGDEDDDVDDEEDGESLVDANSLSNKCDSNSCETTEETLKSTNGINNALNSINEKNFDSRAGKRSENKYLESLLETNQLIVAVKICCDFLETRPEVLSASVQGSQKLWARFVNFINLLVQVISDFTSSEKSNSCDPSILNKMKEWKDENWVQEYCFPEDITLNGLKVLGKQECKNIGNSSWLSEIDQLILRATCLRRFTFSLTKNPESGIEYNDGKDEFVYTRFDRQSSVTEVAANDTKKESNEHRQNLMHNMAQLWLEAEVKELESSVQSLDRPRFSPYIIPDISVLLTHLDLIAQLMASKIFIFILPIVVLQHLDEKKKESSKARKAIRWLETEFRKHNRYLRAQKRHERMTLPLLKYPKRRDKEAWNVFSVLECAKYFSRYGNKDKSASSCLSTILVTSTKTANSNVTDELEGGGHNCENSTLIPLAHSSDLKVESVVDFYNQWKSSTRKPKKKRPTKRT